MPLFTLPSILRATLFVMLSIGLTVSAQTPTQQRQIPQSPSQEAIKNNVQIKPEIPLKTLPDLRKNLELKKDLKISPQNEVLRGGISDGGGNSVGTELYDFYENEGTGLFVITENRTFRERVMPILTEIEEQIPELASNLKSSLDKKWLLEEKDFSEETECLNSGGMIASTRQVIACQTQFEVRISKAWFETDYQNRDNEQMRSGIIFHELLVGFAQKKNLMTKELKASTENSIRELNRIIHSANFSPVLLRDEVAKRFGMTFKTKDEMNQEREAKESYDLAIHEVRSQIADKICPQGKGKSINDALNFISDESLKNKYDYLLKNEEYKFLFSMVIENFRNLLKIPWDGTCDTIKYRIGVKN